MIDKIAYTDLTLKPPVTLRITIPRDNLVNAKSKLGTTVGGATINVARWQLGTYMCPEGESDCTTPKAGVVILIEARRAENQFVLIVSFRDFYVLQGEAIFQTPLFKFGQETDITVDTTFRDSIVTVTLNGKEVLSTDTLKRFEQIRKVEAYNVYIADTTEVQGDSYLTYNLQIVKAMDISGMLTPLISIAVAIGVVLAVTALLGKGLRLPLPVPRAS